MENKKYFHSIDVTNRPLLRLSLFLFNFISKPPYRLDISRIL